MRINYFAFMLVAMCVTSCFHANLFEAMRVSKNFPKEYTGLDTLIRIDGYYYMEDSTGVKLPFFFSKNGEFKIFSLGKMKSHEELQRIINSFIPFDKNYTVLGDTMFQSHNGNYTLSGNTINIKWTRPYALGHYRVYSEKYLIVNDTTLRQIWLYSTPFNDKKCDTVTNDLYHFYEYKFAKK
jgi:hypothetical protein